MRDVQNVEKMEISELTITSFFILYKKRNTIIYSSATENLERMHEAVGMACENSIARDGSIWYYEKRN